MKYNIYLKHYNLWYIINISIALIKISLLPLVAKQTPSLTFFRGEFAVSEQFIPDFSSCTLWFKM